LQPKKTQLEREVERLKLAHEQELARLNEQSDVQFTQMQEEMQLASQ